MIAYSAGKIRATSPLALIRQMNGGASAASARAIRGNAATMASTVSTPLALPPVNTNAASFAATSAFRSNSRIRMCLSRVRTTHRCWPAIVSHS